MKRGAVLRCDVQGRGGAHQNATHRCREGHDGLDQDSFARSKSRREGLGIDLILLAD